MAEDNFGFVEDKDSFGFTPDYTEDNFTPSNHQEGLKHLALQGLAALGKSADTLRGTTTGPLIGSLLEAYSGKKVYDKGEVGGAINPTNLETFPTVSTMMERAGIANPALSDAIPGIYADPKKENPWWKMEKGGRLDPTVGGAINIASDPAMYVGLGELGAAEKVLRASRVGAGNLATRAAKLAVKPAVIAGKAVGYGSGAKLVGSVAEKGIQGLAKLPVVGKTAATVARTAINPLGMGMNAVGKYFYGSPLLPVIQQGEEMGKRGISDDLFSGGAISPIGLNAKAQTMLGPLHQAAEGIRQAAGAAEGDLPRILAAGRAKAAQLASSKAPGDIADAQSILREMDQLEANYSGKPAIPGVDAVEEVAPTIGQVPVSRGPTKEIQGLRGDVAGVPRTELGIVNPGVRGRAAVPEVPAVPRTRVTMPQLNKLKQYFNRDVNQSRWKVGAPAGASEMEASKELGRLARQEEINIAEATLGKGADYADINRAYGGLKSARTGMNTVGRQGERNLHSIGTPTGWDSLLYSAGMAGGGHNAGLASVLANKLGYISRFGTMPTGYGLRRFGETGLVDRLNRLRKEKQDLERKKWLK